MTFKQRASINNLFTHSQVVANKLFLINFQTLLHVFGVSLVLTGDSLLDGENALMILNHPTR